MKKVLFIASALVIAGLAFAFMPKETKVVEDTAKPTLTSKKSIHAKGPINWMTWEEAVEANEKRAKKIFIDFYTNWCGWCKKIGCHYLF